MDIGMHKWASAEERCLHPEQNKKNLSNSLF